MMRFLDRFLRIILLACMTILSGYILLRSVTIAGENGMFQDSPLLSAIYRKVESFSMEVILPVLSYHPQTGPQADIEQAVIEIIYPSANYSDSNHEFGQQQEEEYELILQAEARAEEEKKPLDMEQWVNNQKKERTIQEQTENSHQSEEEEFLELLNQYFSMDAATTIDSSRLNNRLFDVDLTLDPESPGPEILIYHSHSQEGFTDTVEGDDTTTIVGVGDYLTELLRENYGYEVIHDRNVYDLVNGVLDRNLAYDYSARAVETWLQKYPQIQVVIDLHRDGVDGKKFVINHQGKETARLMFILGMSRTADQQDISYLPNPYIEENMAFALQMQKKAQEHIPGLMRNIYLMAYRFNLHYRPRSILLEAGTQLNTLQEEKNAMEVFAEILDMELKGK